MRDVDGFSLVEALVAVFILTMVSLSLAQMIGLGMLSDKSSTDLTGATALSTDKIEELRGGDYSALFEGGSLDSNSSGYFDTTDIDSDGVVDFTRRWKITDQTGGKTLEVTVIAMVEGLGPVREATMATVVAER